MEPKRPVNQYLQDQANAGRDNSLYEGLANFNPLGLGFTSLSGEQKDKFDRVGLSASDFESRGLLGNLFPKWALSDALSKKRDEARTVIKPALAAQNYQYDQQEYLLNRAQRERNEDVKMNFDLSSKMADKNLQGAKELAEQQGKLNLRQAMFSSAMQRSSTPINWLR